MDRETIEARLDQKFHKLDIPEVVAISHETSKLKGWWENPDRNIPEQLCLIHSEISEALEEYRSGAAVNLIRDSLNPNYDPSRLLKLEGVGIELADAVIRIADFCGRYGIDLEACLRAKMRYNLTRPHRHGGKVC